MMRYAMMITALAVLACNPPEPTAEAQSVISSPVKPVERPEYPCEPEKHPCEADLSATVVLAADGSGDARTFLEAYRRIDEQVRTILVKPGTYRMAGSSAEFIRKTCSPEHPCALVAADSSAPPVFDWGVTTWERTGNDPRTGLIIAGSWWLIDGVVFQNAEYPVYIDAPHVTVRNSVIRQSAYDGMMVSQRHGGFVRIEGNTFTEIGTRFSAEVNTTPRHAIYYNTDARVTDGLILNNDISWCTGAAAQIKAQRAYEENKEGAGIYGLVFANNVVLNCKDGLNFYFWVFDSAFHDNTFIFTADAAERRRYNIVHDPTWLQLRSSGGNTFERNLVYYPASDSRMIIGYQAHPRDPSNDSNTFRDNTFAVSKNGGRFGWNQRGAGMDAPERFSRFTHQEGGRIVEAQALELSRAALISARAARNLQLATGARLPRVDSVSTER